MHVTAPVKHLAIEMYKNNLRSSYNLYGLSLIAPVNCGDPGRITNGRRFVNGTTQGSTVRFMCSHGYALCGSDERTCLGEGEWSASVPSCKSK